MLALHAKIIEWLQQLLWEHTVHQAAAGTSPAAGEANTEAVVPHCSLQPLFSGGKQDPEAEGKGKYSWRLLCPPCVCWKLPGTGVAHPAVTTALWWEWGCSFTPGCSLHQWPHHLAQHLLWQATGKRDCIPYEVRAAVSQTFPSILFSPAHCSPKKGDERLAPGLPSPWWSQQVVKPSPEGSLATKSQKSSEGDFFSCLCSYKPCLLWFETAHAY